MSERTQTHAFVYRGYAVTSSPMNNLYWITKHGFGIAWADSAADARARIDTLLERKAYQDAISGANPRMTGKLIEGLKRSQ